jgi:hypothetical protein
MKENKYPKEIDNKAKQNPKENEGIENRQFLSNNNVDGQVAWASPSVSKGRIYT